MPKGLPRSRVGVEISFDPRQCPYGIGDGQQAAAAERDEPLATTLILGQFPDVHKGFSSCFCPCQYSSRHVIVASFIIHINICICINISVFQDPKDTFPAKIYTIFFLFVIDSNHNRVVNKLILNYPSFVILR